MKSIYIVEDDRDLAGEESFNDMVVERMEELDYLDHVDGYVMKNSRASDRIQLQKAGIIN